MREDVKTSPGSSAGYKAEVRTLEAKRDHSARELLRTFKMKEASKVISATQNPLILPLSSIVPHQYLFTLKESSQV